MKTLRGMGLLLFLCTPSAVFGEGPINAWIKPGSGDWQEQTAWSLGILPAQSQTIMLTNQGWKAIAIRDSTAQNFPGSLNVDSVIVSGYTDSFNVLLLNYAGTDVPLRTANGLYIDAGGEVQNLYSGLIVDSGSLTVSNSQFIQVGGVVVTTNAWLRLDNSTYNLTNGLLQAGQVSLGLNKAASFVQDGGSASMTSLRIGRLSPYGPYGTSTYDLVNGWLSIGYLTLEAEADSAVFNQHGGTNFASTLQLEPPLASAPVFYNLSGGMFTANAVNLVGDGNSAYFNQTAGTAFITNTLTVLGGSAHGTRAHEAVYTITGGTLSADTLNISGNQGYSVYAQSNGAVRITENIYLGGSTYTGNLNLSGGTLACSNIYSSAATGDIIEQDGGALIVSNLFSFGGQYTPWGGTPSYFFNGGTLSASNMELFAEWRIGSSAQAGRISNPGWFKLGFTILHIADADEHLGGFILVTNVPDHGSGQYPPLTNSIIALDGSSSKLSFADSRAESWTSGAMLVINNWNGNPSGGGAEQIKFGTSASGLTASQLAQITFSSPGGFPAGNYPARLLSTGELVPNSGATVTDTNINNWIVSASERWDDFTSWSLGILPASNQTVNITNVGYKAANIDSATFANFPASATVSNLFVSAPTNGLSTLLLNYAGVSTPLKVRNNCVIGTNGTLDNFSSSFEVDGIAGGQLLVDGGNFTQVGGQTVVNAPVSVNNGSVNATNGNMTLGGVTLGATSPIAIFNQSGGSIAAASLSLLQGNYNLYDGTLYALGGTGFPFPGGTFNHYGGTNFGDVYMEGGYPSSYRLLAGLLRGTNVSVNTLAMFCQGGGQAQAALVSLTGQAYQTTPNYFLTNGVLRVGTLSIHSSGFLQINGQVIITNPLSIYGYDMPVVHTGDYDYFANYTMQAGTLSCPSLTVTQYVGYSYGLFASFTQNGGTNTVAGDLALYSTTYSLNGSGYLQTSNCLLSAGAAAQGNGNGSGVFQQQSGTHNVTGMLSINAGNKYYINGGTLSVGQMWMHGLLAIGSANGTPTVSCSGVLDLGGVSVSPGVVQVQAGTHHLGSLRLTGNSSLGFGNGAATVHFDSSSAIGWSNGVSLVISNWNNSGNTHIFFGNNASALTASQLAQIQFSNPGGFAQGNYPAQVLPTGEVIPANPPTLGYTKNGGTLSLQWGTGWYLQSATNLTGPYQDVSGANSPWPVSMTRRQEFFRLRQ